MRFIFKSDKFSLIHPTLSVRVSKEYSVNELKEAESNTKRIHYDTNLLSEARDDSYNELPLSQIGSMLVLPEVSEENTDILTHFIKNTFSDVQSRLESEYCDRLDPTSFFNVTNDGSIFNSKYVFQHKNSEERFSPKSICIYVAGCKPNTAEYLFDEFIDEANSQSAKHDNAEKKIKEKKDSSYIPCLIGFDSIKSFLVYSFEEKRFKQIGFNENELFYVPSKQKSQFDRDIIEYSISIGKSVD